MGPHPLPGDALDGKTAPVNVEKSPSVLLLLLRGMVRRRRRGLLPGAAAQEAVRAAALGPAVPAQLGRGGAGPARGAGSSHRPHESQEEEEFRTGTPPPATSVSCYNSVFEGPCRQHAGRPGKRKEIF